MAKLLFEISTLLAVAAIVSIPFFGTKGRGLFALGVITAQVIINTVLAFSIFANGSVEFFYPGSWITGLVPIRIDYLSAWFILVISFTFLTGAWYGFHYMKVYSGQKDKIAFHIVAFLLAYNAMISICVVQNSLIFLIIWEIMSLSSFVLIIFDHNKTETLKAGINFLIQSHIGILFITIAFMWVKIKTGSFDFTAVTSFTSSQPALTGIGLFIFFFIGFAIKAGFVPFHTWLPLAHPIAPSHISGIMSGVIIKIGIFGILRFLMIIKTDMGTIGYFILAISVITGVYGVMLAIIQHNLKKLLAYHSIENIGIIGIGIGLGCLGIKYNNQLLLVVGFGGALLHTLNHSLFKSLLFFSAGTVYQAKHTMNIEALGGLIKKMPYSACLFLIGSLAICGLPPLNGFISEFLIYSGLFHGLASTHFIFILFMLFTILSLVIIGGLAMICFTKAFGMVFLGSPRQGTNDDLPHEKTQKSYPLYLIAAAILFIGLFPYLFIPCLLKIIGLFPAEIIIIPDLQLENLINNLTAIGWCSLGFIAFVSMIFGLRYLILSRRKEIVDTTWGCGYTGNTAKMQYTASSYVRSYRKLAEPLLLIKKEKKDVSGLYPIEIYQHTDPADKIETWLIDKPILFIRRFLNRFVFLQSGNIQAYILYGFIFIGLAVLLPIIIDKFEILLKFLKQL